ncbi:hypothetical protein CFP56_037904 [Quercus suber]|uniref:Uncharacterized protein n=1 Tax=Quercus suber TaxID=58331 RepID=A0AAW0J3P5_QUESU
MLIKLSDMKWRPWVGKDIGPTSGPIWVRQRKIIGHEFYIDKVKLSDMKWRPWVGKDIGPTSGPIWVRQRKIIGHEFYIDKVKVNSTLDTFK